MKFASCHPSKPAHTAALCRACYDRELKRRNPAYAERQRANARGYYRRNRDRQIQRARANGPTPQKRRERALRREYGLTLQAYDAMLAGQGGACAICQREPTGGKPLHVDHDHLTGRVRGLLCFRCNRGIGLLSDNADRLLAAAGYLRASETTT